MEQIKQLEDNIDLWRTHFISFGQHQVWCKSNHIYKIYKNKETRGHCNCGFVELILEATWNGQRPF